MTRDEPGTPQSSGLRRRRRGATHVAVLYHENDAPRHSYLLTAIAPYWLEWGITAEAVYGTHRQVDADLVVNQVNLSVVPDEYLAYMSRYPRAVNGSVIDITKRKISANLLSRDDDYDGPVIVKADRNSGGIPEDKQLPQPLVTRAARRLRSRLGLGGQPRLEKASFLHADNYRVFDSLADVPGGVFTNPALIVEKFLPEMEGDLFATRYYVFLGDKYVNVRLTSRTPVVKGNSMIGRDEVPLREEIVAERERLGFDYGKFDYVVRDGGVVLVDANRTPGNPHGPGAPTARALAEGIRQFL